MTICFCPFRLEGEFAKTKTESKARASIEPAPPQLWQRRGIERRTHLHVHQGIGHRNAYPVFQFGIVKVDIRDVCNTNIGRLSRCKHSDSSSIEKPRADTSDSDKKRYNDDNDQTACRETAHALARR